LGGLSARRKGTQAEVELARMLWERGFAVVRGPSSGGGVRRRFQPDLVAMLGGRIFVFEVKTVRSSNTPLYIESHKIIALEEFTRRAGGQAFIAVRIRGGEWRFHTLDRLQVTRGGNFRLDRPGSGLRLRDLEHLAKGGTTLTDYLG
jgi:Holliday junction resolvase